MEPSVVSLAHLSDLARLELPEAEQRRQERDFRAVVELVGALANVPAVGGPLTATVSGVSHVVREDVPAPSSLGEELLAQAPERRGRCIRVPVVL